MQAGGYLAGPSFAASRSSANALASAGRSQWAFRPLGLGRIQSRAGPCARFFGGQTRSSPSALIRHWSGPRGAAHVWFRETAVRARA